MNVEVDLVAFISLLSVCICFLLLTTIWIQIGSMDVKQAVGGQPASESKPKPEMWVVMEKEGAISVQLRNSPTKIMKTYGRSKIEGTEGKPNLEEMAKYLVQLKGEFSEISIALIRPAEKTPFEDIIQLMDLFKQEGIEDLGVTPL